MKETKFRNIKMPCGVRLLLSAQFWLHTQVLLEAQGSWLEDELNDRERIMLLSGLITKPVMLLLQSTTLSISAVTIILLEVYCYVMIFLKAQLLETCKDT